MDLKDYIRSIPDYPKKGILFRDITTLIKNEKAFSYCIDLIVKKSKNFINLDLSNPELIEREIAIKIKKVFIYVLAVLSVSSIVRFSSYTSFFNFEHSNLFDPRPIAEYVSQKNGYLKLKN